jgi:hypothetical protein
MFSAATRSATTINSSVCAELKPFSISIDMVGTESKTMHVWGQQSALLLVIWRSGPDG